MHYYKILSAGAVIDAGCVFLRWQPKHRILVGCAAGEAHFIQSSDQAQVWRVPWLNPVPAGAPTFETVQAVEIDADEYAALRRQLDAGLTVAPPAAPEAPAPETAAPEPAPETPVMTLEAMRRRLAELEAAVARLEAR